MAQLGATQYSSVVWTAGDVLTEAKLDNMVANDQAYDSHAAQGILLNNNIGFCGNDSGGTARDLLYIDTSDDISFGDSNLGDINVQNKLVLGDSMPSTNVRCRVYLGTNQNLTSGDYSVVELDTEDYDTGNDFNTTTHKYTVPVSGYYQVNFCAMFRSIGADQDALRVMLWDDSQSSGSEDRLLSSKSASGTGWQDARAGDILYFTSGANIWLKAKNDDNNDTLDASQPHSTYLSIHLLST